MPEPCKTLAEALVALQAQLPRIPKSDEGQIQSRTYKYANLADITDTLFPIMTGLGLAWSCKPTLNDEGRFVLKYRLLFGLTGEWDGGEYPLPDASPQQQGSAITYARRYALNAVTGIAPADDDDDAQAAERAAQSDQERDQAGRMTRAQQQEHKALRTLESPRRADRGPVEDDPWAMNPEERPGSSIKSQHTTLGMLYSKIGITERESRLTDMTDRVGREITSAKDLSYVEASRAIADMTELVEGEH